MLLVVLQSTQLQFPSTPYTTNEEGHGPAFNNSLFEDFCEFGMGMAMGNKKMRERIAVLLNESMANDHTPAEFKEAAQEWLDNMNDADASKVAAAKLKPLIAAGAEKGCPVCAELKTLDHYLVKRSQWIIGGDGASYDIGYGVSTTLSLLVRTLTSWFLILRFTLTLVVRVLSLLHSVLLLSSQLRVSVSARRTSV